ncbi:unnamed protein product [Caenorhabditis auriculariae]|uniref:Uncharacterized protein n=1 Tax=Caenorhabditis auriculariae TaxID=2777116 RepID=A0A8S1H6G4_9PELO|nr:unnamed protein product [Caenorhabditis auriculariae]
MRSKSVFLLLALPTLLVAESEEQTGRKQKRDDSDKDKAACAELREEYIRVCAKSAQHKKDAKEEEFCQAFDNICLAVSPDDPDGPVVTEPEPSRKKKKKRIDFTRFCKEFKNRYLYVCPDPFRFGQKAIVFCPIYSERCHVPLPDHPVVPTRKPAGGRSGGSTVDQICRSYRGFALNYCNNPLLTAQAQYRTACDKYWRYCGHRNG